MIIVFTVIRSPTKNVDANEVSLINATNSLAKDGKIFSERIWGSKDKLINELHADLTQNVLLGKPPKDLINNLVKKFNTTKAMHISIPIVIIAPIIKFLSLLIFSISSSIFLPFLFL